MDQDQKHEISNAGSGVSNESGDEELLKLLDSSLQEFGKTAIATPEKAATKVDVDSLGAAPNFDKESAQKASADFQNMLRQLSEMQKVLLEQVKTSATQDGSGVTVEGANDSGVGTATATATATAGGPDEVQLAQEFLQNLNFFAEKAQKIQEAGNEDDLENAIRQLQNDNNYENSFLPFMQGLMSSLLSKETLYPSLKEMSEKYQPWLDENRGKADQHDLERYEAQFRLIQQACKEYEEEKDDDPDDVKGQRFERLITIMQNIQSFGHPPEDLVGALPPGWAMDDRSGLPHVVDQEKAAESCCIM